MASQMRKTEDAVRNRQKTRQVCDWLASKQTASPLGEEALTLGVDGSLRRGCLGNSQESLTPVDRGTVLGAGGDAQWVK